MRAKFGVLEQTHGIRLRAKFRLILLPSGGKKKTKFCRICGLRQFVVSAIGSNLRTLSTGIKRYQNRFCTPTPWRNRVQCTISDFQQRDGQANQQTNKKTQRFGPRRRLVKSEPNQSWHGDKGPRARSCTSKTFGRPTHSFAARGAEHLGNPIPST